jgi:hypothetical protein
MAWSHYSSATQLAPSTAVVPDATPHDMNDPEADRLMTSGNQHSNDKDYEKDYDKGRDREMDMHRDETEGRKRERAEVDRYMVLHHLITAALCIGSWALNYTRIGALVMFLHDVSDVPLDVMRLCGRYVCCVVLCFVVCNGSDVL